MAQRLHIPLFLFLRLLLLACRAWAAPKELDEVKASGALRHLGIAYANFITGQGAGSDAGLQRLFARHLGVRDVFLPTDWDTVFLDLIGHTYKNTNSSSELTGPAPIKGDIPPMAGRHPQNLKNNNRTGKELNTLYPFL